MRNSIRNREYMFSLIPNSVREKFCVAPYMLSTKKKQEKKKIPSLRPATYPGYREIFPKK